MGRIPVESRTLQTRPGSNDFLAVGPALRILQLNVEGLSAAKRSCIIRDIAEKHNRHNVDVICLQETHVNVDCASRFSSTRQTMIIYDNISGLNTATGCFQSHPLCN